MTERRPGSEDVAPPRGGLARRLALGAVVSSLSVLVALLLAEGALRLSGVVTDRGGVYTVTTRQFDEVPGIFGPGQDATVHSNPQLPYSVSVNELGFRGDPLPPSQPGGRRILFAGDSFVFGDFVDDAETLPAQVEARLRAVCGEPITVVNAGLGGSTIRDQAHMIRRGLVLDPDLVVLQFGENDILDLAGPYMWQDLAENRAVKSGFPLGLIYPVVRSSALWNLALRSVALARARRAEADLSAETDEPVDDTEDLMSTEAAVRLRGVYRDHLVQLRDTLELESVPLLMTAFPAHLSVYDLWDSDQLEWLAAMTDSLGIDLVSFLEPLRGDGRDETELYLLPHDGHASPEGYAVAADHLASRIARTGPIGPC